MRILLVDDRLEHLEELQDLLSSEGHEAFVAQDGLQALDFLRKHNVDAVVTDVLMPQMDGYSLCRALRKEAGFQKLPVLFLSATYTSDLDMDFARRIGADAFLVRPCDPNLLLNEIQQAIEARAQVSSQPQNLTNGDPEILKLYNQRLVHKLEQKMQELEKQMSENNKSMQALKRNESLLKSTQAIGKLGGWEYDIQSKELYLTDGVWEILDVDRGKAETQSFIELSLQGFPEDVQNELRQLRKRLAQSGQAYDLQSWYHTQKNNKIFLRSVSQSEVVDGEVRRISGVLQDITEIKLAQLKQEELSQQLLQIQKLESIGQLAGGVAHDFNNVLTVILGYAEEILAGMDAQNKIYPDIQEIIAAGTRASTLTRQLLTFSRKQIIKPEVHSLNEIILNLNKMLIRLLGEDVQIDLDLAEDLPYIFADVGQIEQVIVNLAVNARDAMPAGGRISFKTFRHSTNSHFLMRHPAVKEGNYAVLSVSDCGMGMDQNVKDRVFEPFFTTKERGHGTGLGLATVYGIVRQANGHITVNSSLGKGSSFVILFPQAEGELVEIAKKTEQILDARGNELILIVEDDLTIADLTAKMCAKLGYQSRVTYSSDEALKLIVEEGLRPDLLIIDVVMPGMNGLELTSVINSNFPEIRLLLMSGYAENVLARLGEVNPRIPFLQKPFNRQELSDFIQKALAVK